MSEEFRHAAKNLGVPRTESKATQELNAAPSWEYVETEHAAVVIAGTLRIQPHWRGLGDTAELRRVMMLCAAAPALYEACKTMVESLDGSPTNFAGMLAAHRKLDAAILLANGQATVSLEGENHEEGK